MNISPLLLFLARLATEAQVSPHVYVVGGAVRNHVMGVPIKDFDLAFDQVSLNVHPKNSEWFARYIQKSIPVKTSLAINQYGVAILTVCEPWELDGVQMNREVIEIANARKESYGGESGKGYKPHLVAPATIQEDLERREFTFNTLMWRLSDLHQNPQSIPVIDMLGCGLADLAERVIRTPRDPDVTFSDDPTRMLRAVKFHVKYKFYFSTSVRDSIFRNAEKLKQMPWDAVRKILMEDLLETEHGMHALQIIEELGLARVVREMMEDEPGFATAVGRSMVSLPPRMAFHVHRLGWPVRTAITFLQNESDRKRLEEILISLSDTESVNFCNTLLAPPIQQKYLFETYRVPPPERKQIVNVARRALLREPILAKAPDRLFSEVEDAVAAVYQKM